MLSSTAQMLQPCGVHLEDIPHILLMGACQEDLCFIALSGDIWVIWGSCSTAISFFPTLTSLLQGL